MYLPSSMAQIWKSAAGADENRGNYVKEEKPSLLSLGNPSRPAFRRSGTMNLRFNSVVLNAEPCSPLIDRSSVDIGNLVGRLVKGKDPNNFAENEDWSDKLSDCTPDMK